MEAPTAIALLSSLGRGFGESLADAYCARGPDAVDELLAALAAPHVAPDGARRDRLEPANNRAYAEELEDCLGRLADAYPERFVEAVATRPALRERFVVLAVLGRMEAPRATAWLLEALSQSSGHNRWVALSALLARREERVVPHLPRLLRDRDSSVAFCAVDGLRRWGEASNLDALLTYSERAPIGARERAWDAMEAICDRAAVPLPKGHPGRRLTAVRLPQGTELRPGVTVALHVRQGTILATNEHETFRAPCDSVVAAIDEEVDGAACVVLRRVP